MSASKKVKLETTTDTFNDWNQFQNQYKKVYTSVEEQYKRYVLE